MAQCVPWPAPGRERHMERTFSTAMSELRKTRGLSQRAAAADLGISQALLSHYENGAREPGLAFVCRACRYYGVSADFMLGLADDAAGEKAAQALRTMAEQLKTITQSAEAVLKELDT